jgi:hypothetical protein
MVISETITIFGYMQCSSCNYRFWKTKLGLCDVHLVCVSPLPPISCWKIEPVFMKLGMYIMAPEPMSTAYFINPSHQSVYLPIVATQRLGIHVLAATKNCWRRRLLCGPCGMKVKNMINSSQNFSFHFGENYFVKKRTQIYFTPHTHKNNDTLNVYIVPFISIVFYSNWVLSEKENSLRGGRYEQRRGTLFSKHAFQHSVALSILSSWYNVV